MNTKTDRTIAEAATSRPESDFKFSHNTEFRNRFNPQKVTQMLDERDELRELAKGWEVEAKFLAGPHDSPTDRASGRTYRECANKIREVLGE